MNTTGRGQCGQRPWSRRAQGTASGLAGVWGKDPGGEFSWALFRGQDSPMSLGSDVLFYILDIIVGRGVRMAEGRMELKVSTHLFYEPLGGL